MQQEGKREPAKRFFHKPRAFFSSVPTVNALRKIFMVRRRWSGRRNETRLSMMIRLGRPSVRVSDQALEIRRIEQAHGP
jgi:hypothetical protein